MRRCTPFTLFNSRLMTINVEAVRQVRMLTSLASNAQLRCALLPHSRTSLPSSSSPLASSISLLQQQSTLSTRSGKNSKRGKKMKIRRTTDESSNINKTKSSKVLCAHSAKVECDSNVSSEKSKNEQHAKSKCVKKAVEIHCMQSEAKDEVNQRNEFSKLWHECFSIPYEEFLLGAHQAYYTVGGVLKLIDCELPNTKAAERPFYSHDNAIQVFADVIKDKFDIESSELLDNTETINDEERMEEERESLKEIASNCNIWHFDMSATSASWRNKASFYKFMHQVVPAFNSFLPCSIAFTHSIFQLWWAQHLRMYNIRSIAGPTDYIMASEIVLFASLDSLSTVKQKGGKNYIDPRGKKKEVKEDKTECKSEKGDVMSEESTNASVESHTATIKFYRDDNKDEPTCIDIAFPVMWWNHKPFTDSKYIIPEWNGRLKELMHHVEQMRIKEHNTETAEVEINVPEVSSDTSTNSENIKREKDVKEVSNDKEAKEKVGETNDNENSFEFCEELNKYRVKINSFTEFYAPQDARALVVVVLDVVIPPARTFDEYDTMYSFTSVIKNVFKRATVSRFLAAKGLSKVLTVQDYFVRLMTGESFKDAYVKSSLPLMDLPADAETQVPTVRKYLCLYMDAAKQ